jgi:hypothetical protein
LQGRNGQKDACVKKGDLVDLLGERAPKGEEPACLRSRGAREIGNKDRAARGVRGFVVAKKPANHR